MGELDDILSGATPEPEVITPEPEQAPEPEVTAEPATEPDTGVKEQSPSPGDTEKALQMELARIRAKNRELEAQLQRPEPEKPDFWENPEQVMNERETKLRTDMSEEFMRMVKPDYDEKLAIFLNELAPANPMAQHEIMSKPNPAKAMYDYVENTLKMREMSNPQEYEAKIKTEVETKLRAEYDRKLEEELKRRDIPGSLADTRGVSGHTAAVVVDPPLSDILN